MARWSPVASPNLPHLMDTFSLIVDDMRLQGAVFANIGLTAPWAVQLHTPGQASFHIVTSGQGWLLLRGQEPVLVQTGDLVVLPSGATHVIQDTLQSRAAGHPIDILSNVNASSMDMVYAGGGGGDLTTVISGYFRFDAIMAAPLIAALPPLMHIRSLSAQPPLWLALGLQFLGEEVRTPRPAQQSVVNRLADIMLIQCMRDHVEALPTGSRNWLLALRDKSLSTALGQMHREPARNWSVQELAEIACLSRSAFADRFGAALGMPPLTYLTHHRMRLAARQLLVSNHPIGLIADSVGYQSNNAFSQAFKREFSCTPSEFRERGEAGALGTDWAALGPASAATPETAAESD
jgi:AraC-like DNA-binding protein